MFAGRKLLLADDSLAVQKVIDLTFTDEGMHVSTFPDGQLALEHLEQIAPDVILADIFMPGVDGYELCRTVKQSQRFRRTPVMLLVGSFEPFDEAEARRAGADDVVTKPFQSIRELVSRVGLLLSGQQPEPAEQNHDYSTLGLVPGTPLSEPEASYHETDPMPGIEPEPEPEPRVFVEAASISEDTAETLAGPACSSDLELQTADTIELERIDLELPAAWQPTPSHEEPAPPDPVMNSQPLETGRPQPTTPIGAPDMIEPMSSSPEPKMNEVINDSILDLGDVDDFAPRAVTEDFILDLDYEETETAKSVVQGSAEVVAAEAPSAIDVVVEQPLYAAPLVADRDWPEPQALIDAANAAPEPLPAMAGGLSDEQIDAIARRVVEHLSDKVVREIAWEVVPDLAELLIKKKLAE